MGWFKKADGCLIFSDRDPAWVADGVEIRCPGKFSKLFLILLQEHMPKDTMLMEIACADCAKEARAAGKPDVIRALHYYDATGTCVHTKFTTKE
jgi:hypothetical protein